MRRRIRKEFAWSGNGFVPTNEVRYVYDSNLAIQERDVNNLPQVTHTRGKDVSGSLEGAGGTADCSVALITHPSTLTKQPDTTTATDAATS